MDNKFQMKFKKKIEFLVKHENQSLLSACEGGGGVGGEVDGFRGITWFKRGTEGGQSSPTEYEGRGD